MIECKMNRIGGLALCLAMIGGLVAPLSGAINLEWRPLAQTGEVDGLVEIGLYAVSDNPEENQLLSALDVIIQWDPAYLELLGTAACPGCPSWLFSGFSDDPYGINETSPPQDGDGIYTLFAPLGAPVAATPAGTRLVVFQFTALAVTSDTPIAILESAGDPLGYTAVYDGTVPGLDVTGTLGEPVQVEIVCQLCPGDLVDNGHIDLVDLAELLAHYGMTSGARPSEGDMDCDGDVDLIDLAALLSVYGTQCD